MLNGLTSNCKEEKEIQGISVSKQPTPSLNSMLGVNHSCVHGNLDPLTILWVKKPQNTQKNPKPKQNKQKKENHIYKGLM